MNVIKNLAEANYVTILKSEEAISKDLETENRFKTIFPDKKIVMLDCTDLNRAGGVFHCIRNQ